MAMPETVKFVFLQQDSMAESNASEHAMKDMFNPYILLFEFFVGILKWKFEMVFCGIGSKRYPNGTWGGIIGMLNRSEADVTTHFLVSDAKKSEAVDFLYPMKQFDLTFVIRKSQYQPEIWGMFRTFSISFWKILAHVVIIIMLMHVLGFKYKSSPSRILLHVLAVLFRQPATITSSTVGGNLLVYSWVIGAMLLCLSFDTVFLSFLAFSPASGVSTITELANAVDKGQYDCTITSYAYGISNYLGLSKKKEFKIIYKNNLQNPHRYVTFEEYFRHENERTAFIAVRDTVQFLRGKYFISEDSFFGVLGNMAVRKGFPYKDRMDMIIHRLMAAGGFERYSRLQDYVYAAKYLSKHIEGNQVRKLTLTDVGAAFIFLLFCYILSCFILIGEILIGSRANAGILKMRNAIKRKMRIVARRRNRVGVK